MEIKLHKNAKTTPKIREYIQTSNKSVRALSKELSLTETTVRRWKFRNEVYDRSHRPHRLCTTMTLEEEEIIVSLRQEVWLSLDDITEVMKRCVNHKLTRSAIHRCLKRRGVTKRPQESGEVTSLRKRFDKTEFGYVHIDLKYLGGIDKKPGYVFVAIERTTRYVYVEVVHKKDANTIASCLKLYDLCTLLRGSHIKCVSCNHHTLHLLRNNIKNWFNASGQSLIGINCTSHDLI